MSLFGALHDDIFLPFSREKKFLYAETIGALYSDLFGGSFSNPTRAQVVEVVYRVLQEKTDLWVDEGELLTFDDIVATGRRIRRRSSAVQGKAESDGTALARQRANHMYARLVNTGWLEEEAYGLRVTVDMPYGAMLLAEHLVTLKRGFSTKVGGVMSEVKNAVEAVKANPKENALGLNKAAESIGAFTRSMRAILSSLKRIEKDIMGAETHEDRLERYFADFIERLLLRDYEIISTTAHPYRFRHRILSDLADLRELEGSLMVIEQVYVEVLGARSAREARARVFDDIDAIRLNLEHIQEIFRRINRFRDRLESRLRNTVKYATRRQVEVTRRIRDLVAGLDPVLVHLGDQPSFEQVEGLLEPLTPPLGLGLLAEPRESRPPIPADTLRVSPPSAVARLKKRLLHRYLERIHVTPERAIAFLEGGLGNNQSLAAGDLAVDDVEQFIVFDAIRRVAVHPGARSNALGQALIGTYDFRIVEPGDAQYPPWLDNDWIRSRNFVIERKDTGHA